MRAHRIFGHGRPQVYIVRRRLFTDDSVARVPLFDHRDNQILAPGTTPVALRVCSAATFGLSWRTELLPPLVQFCDWVSGVALGFKAWLGLLGVCGRNQRPGSFDCFLSAIEQGGSIRPALQKHDLLLETPVWRHVVEFVCLFQLLVLAKTETISVVERGQVFEIPHIRQAASLAASGHCGRKGCSPNGPERCLW